MQREKQREIDIKFRKEMKRKNLPQEPDESNPDSALIGLRFPHDGTILKRRLLKTDKIQVNLFCKKFIQFNLLNYFLGFV